MQQVLEARQRQPTIEKRIEQLGTVHEIAPMLLKNPARVGVFFTIYFLARVIQSLIERELRRPMTRKRLTSLPLYPKVRHCTRPATGRVLRLFSRTKRSRLTRTGHAV